MMPATPVRLDGSARTALVTHFLGLPADDRRLRFGATLSAEGIRSHVDGMNFTTDAAFAVVDDRLALLGVAHLAFGDDLAEFGLSVLPSHRGIGIGSALFAKAATFARNRRVSLLSMQCLRENTPMMRIARNAGMKLVHGRDKINAYLELPPACVGSIASAIAVT